ncbi:MAG: hypothetical protein ACFFDD_14605 [Promethearchaeota archaeon]
MSHRDLNVESPSFPTELRQLSDNTEITSVCIEQKRESSGIVNEHLRGTDLSLLPRNIRQLTLIHLPVGEEISLRPLREYPQLEQIEILCDDMDFIDLRFLERCPALSTLRVRGVIGIHLFSSGTLTSLDLSNGSLLSPYPLPNRYRDIYTRIDKTQALDLQQLDGCKNLEYLDLSNNKFLLALRLDMFPTFRRTRSLPRIDLRGNDLQIAYLPNYILPEDHTAEDYVVLDRSVLFTHDLSHYVDYLKTFLGIKQIDVE